MVNVTEKAGVKTQVGFNLRFGAAVQRVKALIDAGEAGQPGLALASYFCNSLHSDWWRKKEMSGGQVFEQAIHLADLMRYFLGDVATVYSRQANLFHRDIPEYSVEDVSGTVFGFKNGAVGVMGATNGAIPERWEYEFRLVCLNLTVQFTDANNATLTYTNTPALKTEIVSAEKDIYALEMQDLFDAIEQDYSPRTPMREGALTLDMVAAAMRSAETHCEERIGE
jgi:predicted dehydrogenase